MHGDMLTPEDPDATRRIRQKGYGGHFSTVVPKEATSLFPHHEAIFQSHDHNR